MRARFLAIPMTSALGGETTRPLATSEAFTFVAANAEQSTRQSFSKGNEIFSRTWIPISDTYSDLDGLGPLFNRRACSDCHVNNGRGLVPGTNNDAPESMLVRISLTGTGPNGGPRPVPGYGDQLQDRAIAGVPPEARVRVQWQEISGHYKDGTPYSLREPQLEISRLAYGPLPVDTRFSLRVANPLIGLGLLEMVADETLAALADPDDADGDGISGKLNVVFSPRDREMAVGRFGWKANAANLTSQNAAAAIGDLGITTTVFNDDNCQPTQRQCRTRATHEGVELPPDSLRELNVYTRRLAVPQQRGGHLAKVRAGHDVFLQMGCGDCHVPTLVTGSDPRAPDLSEQIIHPFTDLLLHDMGDGLADDRTDFRADGREWRTPPLWGIGLTAKVSGQTQFLHDGRARSLAEAILWHGGEGERAKEAFRTSPLQRRRVLIEFLNSL